MPAPGIWSRAVCNGSVHGEEEEEEERRGGQDRTGVEDRVQTACGAEARPTTTRRSHVIEVVGTSGDE
ncbi:hypothetical protein J4Q44_G00098620 [Coregonus suidteri]|uniref:Uncharacterized protein n=1 Tax=Coregonus suidteri TaxID=861788 RepID=A0AAN8QZV3_9TELE